MTPAAPPMPRCLRPYLLALPLACGGAGSPELDSTTDVPGSEGSTADTTGAGTTGDGTTGMSTTTGAGSMGADAESGTTSAADMTTGGPGTTSDGTTGAAAYCGDLHVDPGEDCDDGNDDPMDGCKACAGDRLVFVTSILYQGGEIDGLYGADQRCRMLAALAKLPNFATYRAWLSDSKVSAADRLLHHRGRYTLVNGLVVAMDWDDLVDGEHALAIDVTESSETLEAGAVWTGTLFDGQPAFGSSFCFDWTKAKGWGDELGGRGVLTQTDALWSYYKQIGCDVTASLYCFEQ